MTIEETQFPISTKDLLDSVGKEGKKAITSVYKIICPRTNSKGTGFLIDKGIIITNNHVIGGCDEKEIIAISGMNEEILFEKIIKDERRDLAVLFPKSKLNGGLKLIEKIDVEPGIMVCTWGFPLNYNGPAPLLSTGFLAGFSRKNTIKRLIINGAFNEGNSGGPLLKAKDDKVLGVVVAKHLPIITPFIKSAIEALSKNKSGLIFKYSNGSKNQKEVAESQIVAEILKYYHKMSQVVIGEAVESCEVIEFLKENNLK